MLDILTFSSLYPNTAQPDHGVFVEERLRKIVATGEVRAEVVAPVPWFPFGAGRFGRYAVFGRVPAEEKRGEIPVLHPRFVAVPKVGMTVSPYLMALGVRRAVELAKRRRPFQLIDAHYLYPDGVAAVLLGGWLGTPVVLTARGSDVNVIGRYALPRRMIVRAIGCASHVVAVSDALRAELVGIGVEESRISVLRNGVDLEVFRPLGGPKSARAHKRLLVVGHLKEGKGHRLAIDAMARLENYELTVVGDGPLRSELERHARDCGVQDRVLFTGRVAHGELPRFYNDADALVLASEREGMPNVVLEALACGTPVVATAVGGIPEILSDPVAGTLMTSHSPQALVNGVRELFDRYPSRAAVRRFAERFDWHATVRGQVAVFREAVARYEESSA